MDNRQIARLLAETADLMEISGEDGFRIRSYRNAASAIESYPERVLDLLRNPDAKITAIPGVGKGIAAALQEIAQRGSFDRRDEMLAKYPASALELLKIQGLGPKAIALVYEHHAVRNIDDLERICREQKLRLLPRMGAKLEEKVLRSIEAYKKSAGRFLLKFGQSVAAELTAELSSVPGVEKVEAAGSLRRGKETIGDLDFLSPGPVHVAVLQQIVASCQSARSSRSGCEQGKREIRSRRLAGGCARVTGREFRRRHAVFTGSKEHNVITSNPRLKTRADAQRIRAVYAGWKSACRRRN